MIGRMSDDDVIDLLRQRIAAGRATDRGATVPPPPASPEALARAEDVVGLPLPPLLRRIYAEVANGGVGPFHGINGLDGGHVTDTPMLRVYMEDLTADLEPDDPPPLPPGVLFLCDFGCAMAALLDLRNPRGQMWWWSEGDRYKLDLTFDAWVRLWLDGRMPTVPAFSELALADEAWSDADRWGEER